MASSNQSVKKEAFWRTVLSGHLDSGLTVRAFCRKEGVSEPSFYAWRKEIAKRDEQCASGDDPGAPQETPIPLDVVDSVGDDAQCEVGSRSSDSRRESALPLLEVVTPAGFTLRFDHDIEPQRLRVLLSVLQQQTRSKGVSSC